MRDYIIRVVAIRGQDEIELKRIEEQNNEKEFDFGIGNVGDFYPLDRGTRIHIMIESKETQTLSEE